MFQKKAPGQTQTSTYSYLFAGREAPGGTPNYQRKNIENEDNNKNIVGGGVGRFEVEPKNLFFGWTFLNLFQYISNILKNI